MGPGIAHRAYQFPNGQNLDLSKARFIYTRDLRSCLHDLIISIICHGTFFRVGHARRDSCARAFLGGICMVQLFLHMIYLITANMGFG